MVRILIIMANMGMGNMGNLDLEMIPLRVQMEEMMPLRVQMEQMELAGKSMKERISLKKVSVMILMEVIMNQVLLMEKRRLLLTTFLATLRKERP